MGDIHYPLNTTQFPYFLHHFPIFTEFLIFTLFSHFTPFSIFFNSFYLKVPLCHSFTFFFFTILFSNFPHTKPNNSFLSPLPPPFFLHPSSYSLTLTHLLHPSFPPFQAYKLSPTHPTPHFQPPPIKFQSSQARFLSTPMAH